MHSNLSITLYPNPTMLLPSRQQESKYKNLFMVCITLHNCYQKYKLNQSLAHKNRLNPNIYAFFHTWLSLEETTCFFMLTLQFFAAITTFLLSTSDFLFWIINAILFLSIQSPVSIDTVILYLFVFLALFGGKDLCIKCSGLDWWFRGGCFQTNFFEGFI